MILHNVFFFSAEVWGTVSDWVMIAVTAFTLYYLRKTLQSQLAVQSMQQELAQYERHRFLLSIKPSFSGTGELKSKYIALELRCINSTAMDTFMLVKDSNKYNFALNFTMKPLVEVDYVLAVRMNLVKPVSMYFLDVALFFKDIEGNCFQQSFSIIKYSQLEKLVFTSIPATSINLVEYNEQKEFAIPNTEFN